MRPQFEAGDTVQFTWVSSVPPDSAPRFNMLGRGDALVGSMTAIYSGGSDTMFYAMVTMPNSADGVYVAEWYAEKTMAGSTYPFVRRMLFNVARTNWKE